MAKYYFILLICLVVLARAEEAKKEETVKSEAEAVVEVEEEVETKKAEEGDGKNATDADEELPETVRVGDTDVRVDRTDKTETANVTFEISFGQKVVGNITFGLFGKACPKTVRNFLTLADPLRGEGHGYKGSIFHRIVKGFAVQGGDYLNNDGSAGWSIYGRFFPDENLDIEHFPFCLSMANSGRDTNASQFFIPLIKTSWLNKKHVVFGRVKTGHQIIKDMNSVPTNRFDRPLVQVKINRTWISKIHKESPRSEL